MSPKEYLADPAPRQEEDARAPSPRWRVLILATVLPVLVIFLGLEGLARVVELFQPPRLVDLGQGFSEESRLFVPVPEQPELLQTNPNKLLSFQEQRFSESKAPGTYRIFMLGGSSVNYVYYAFPDLARRLEQRHGDRFEKVELINCGGKSYGSHRLVLIAAEILRYDPDLVLIYSGHNEFEELEQLKLAHLGAMPLQKALGRSALYRFIRDRLASFQISALEKAHNKRIAATAIPDASRAWSHTFSAEESAERMATYRRNLTHMIDLFQQREIPVILGTVPSNLIRPSLPGSDGAAYEAVTCLFEAGRYEEGRAKGMAILMGTNRHQSSDRENAIVRSLAKEKGLLLADVEQRVVAAEPNHIPGETLFGDHCHLNGQGNELLIAAFEAQIEALLAASD